MGLYSSYSNLAAYGHTIGFHFGPAVPIALDVGIPSFLILDSLRPTVLLRGVAWTLAAFTVFANGAAGHGDAMSRIVHMMMPAVPILIFEGIRHLGQDETRMEKVRLSRYLVSPVGTARLRVRMIRWEVTSYREALRVESAVLTARSVLVSEYRQESWRRTRGLVPAELRNHLHNGELPMERFFGPDWRLQVREWVCGVLDELDPHRMDRPAEQDQSELDLEPDSDLAEIDPWDRVWDQRDQFVSDRLPRDVVMFAIAAARDYHEQVNRHISGEDLRRKLSIAKTRANTLAALIRRTYESAADHGDPIVDSPPRGRAVSSDPSGPASDPTGLGGLEATETGALS
jgi:hypothetical protein